MEGFGFEGGGGGGGDGEGEGEGGGGGGVEVLVVVNSARRRNWRKVETAMDKRLFTTHSPIELQISFSEWFMSKGGTRKSIHRMWDPVAYALGFIDSDNISACCVLTIFSLFATKTEASLLRMLKGSPDVYLSGPIKKYIMDKGGRFHLRWGCREVLYDRSADGGLYVTGLAMSKEHASRSDNSIFLVQLTFKRFRMKKKKSGMPPGNGRSIYYI